MWHTHSPKAIDLEAGGDVEEPAKKFPLIGANIVNIVQQVGLKTLACDEKIIKK